MFLELGLILVGLANGLTIPTVVWWLFGIETFLKIVSAIGKEYQEKQKKRGE